jgi:hypothetical protein
MRKIASLPAPASGTDFGHKKLIYSGDGESLNNKAKVTLREEKNGTGVTASPFSCLDNGNPSAMKEPPYRSITIINLQTRRSYTAIAVFEGSAPEIP